MATPRTALIILDMISEFRFPLGQVLARRAMSTAREIVAMKRRAARARWPVIYVNDAPQVWESNPNEHVQRCLEPGARGRRIAELLAPGATDYFLFKPRHSAFYDTPLDSLLARLQIRRLVLTGVTAHQCVLFTAMDAHVRGYQLVVPRACVTAPQAAQVRRALIVLAEAMGAKSR